VVRVGVQGSGVTIGNYIKNEFAPSKNQSVMSQEVSCICALLTLVILYRPLIGAVGERSCVVVGMGVNCLYGPLDYRTAARTLFLGPYLAHFCPVFARFFAVFSVLTRAPKDRGAVA